MMSIDTTFHVNDLLTLGGLIVGTGWFVVRAIVAAYRSMRDELEDHADELTLHGEQLMRMGWKPPKDRRFRPHGRRVNVDFVER